MIRLAIMRPRDKLDESIALAEEHGIEPVCASPLRVEVNDSPEFARFLEQLHAGEIDMMVLTSSTGVEALMHLLDSNGGRATHMPFLTKTRLAAIGPITAKAMSEAGMTPALVPEVYSSEGVVSAISGQNLDKKRIVLLRSNHGEPVLRDGLQAYGAIVDDIVVYSLIPDQSSPELVHLIDEAVEGRIDAFAFTSSLSAKTFMEAAEAKAPGRIRSILGARTVAAMGEPTRRKLEEMGVRVDVVPTKATFTAMLQSILEEENDH